MSEIDLDIYQMQRNPTSREVRQVGKIRPLIENILDRDDITNEDKARMIAWRIVIPGHYKDGLYK